MTATPHPYALDAKYPRFATITHALRGTAERCPNRTAVISGERSITYVEYVRAAAGLAHKLQAMGCAGGRVALLMGNTLDMAVAIHGAMAARAMVSPLNPNYTESEIIPILKDADPTVIIADAATLPRVRQFLHAVPNAKLIHFGDGGLDIGNWIADPAMRLPEPLPRADEPSCMFFTGGTTGLPKGAPHTHASTMAYCYATFALWPLDLDAERFLNVAPLFHVWGFCFSTIAPVYVGATMDIVPLFKPAVVLEEFQKHKITVFAGGPAALYHGLRANENYKTTDFSHIKYCMSGGSACPEELIVKWQQETGSLFLEGWGMSEGAPINLNPIRGKQKVKSTGAAPPDTEVQVVDLDTGDRILPPGEAGEIRVRAPQFIKGYRNRPEENARAFRDGWFYTGDIGYIDEDGYMFLVDRKKEMIIVGGYNVYPREIDELLFKHPAIMEAATVGVPDTFSGDAVKCYVALKPGAKLSADELLDYCKQHLVKYKLPTKIAFVDALPKTGVGKINKLELKARGA
ncbi:MAG: AMP-binding protein [Alphaproteobacteria bacterium]